MIHDSSDTSRNWRNSVRWSWRETESETAPHARRCHIMGVIGVPKQLSSKEELYQRGEFAGRQFSFVEDGPAGVYIFCLSPVTNLKRDVGIVCVCGRAAAAYTCDPQQLVHQAGSSSIQQRSVYYPMRRQQPPLGQVRRKFSVLSQFA